MSLDAKHLKIELSRLVTDLIREVAKLAPDVREGVVMTTGPAPYRRIDCDGRALAYIRVRPRKRAIRIDVSGLWTPPRNSRLAVATATGLICLLVEDPRDLREASSYLAEIVRHTRAETERRRVPAGRHLAPREPRATSATALHG